MKREPAVLITALAFAASLSACSGNVPKTAEIAETAETSDATEITETIEATKTADIDGEKIKEESVQAETESTPEETEEDTAKKEMEKLQSTLGEMPYYGGCVTVQNDSGIGNSIRTVNSRRFSRGFQFPGRV